MKTISPRSGDVLPSAWLAVASSIVAHPIEGARPFHENAEAIVEGHRDPATQAHVHHAAGRTARG